MWIKLGEKIDSRILVAKKAELRRRLGMHSSARITESDEVTRPVVRGESFYWCTRGGSRINYPSAYSKTGFGNMVYNRSTLRIEVPKGYFE